MKIPLKWLQEYVGITLSSSDLANELTMAGIEVKGVQVIGGDWENIVVGQIIAINPHPNADRLTLPTIDLGTEQQTVVCGAPNLKIGDKVAFAPVGAQLIDGHTGQVFRLKSAKIRGVMSSGMACSEKELGISDSHEGIMVLPAEAPVGTPLADYLGDVIFDLDITPNRPDCLCVISNIVDITNYVMLEYGQPLHAFDCDKIRGKGIIVRRAAEGEAVVTLDGVERVLSEDMLVIADKEGSVAIAGVMGGANSEVTQGTTSILLEAANFNPTSIHYTGRRLQLPSEACMRFERGIRPELTLPALKRATQLIMQLAGGEAAKGVVDVYPGKQAQEPILLSTGKVKTVLGVEFSLDQIVGALTSLGFDCKKGDSASEVWVTAPYWRSDIHLAEDLVEEVARVIGYDKIPTTMLSQPLPRQNPAPILGLKQKAGCVLTGYGFQEVITYSLTSLEMLNKLLPEPHPLEPMPFRMANPMTTEREYLRPNLRANFLAAFSANRRHEDGGIRLFELGKVYLPRHNDLPDEPEILCGILGGFRFEKSGQGKDELFDFYDVKGMVESLLNQLNVDANFEEDRDESLCLGKQAAIVVDGKKLGVVGELHPKVLEAFEISEPVYLFEINLTALLPYTISHKMFQPIPRFPAIVRDMALIVGTGVSHQRVLDIIKSFPLVNQVTLFDVYAGEQVPRGKKSLAYRIAFQSPVHTLTDEEVNEVQQRILNKLSGELGATLRG